MIEERAVVRRVEADRVWVDSDRRSGCELCESGRGCGGGVLGKLVGQRASTLPVLSRVERLQPGDAVIVSIDERALVRGSLAAYLVPLLSLFGFALATSLLLDAHDLVVALAGAVGLGVGFLWLSRFSSRVALNPDWQPVIVRRAAAASGCKVGTVDPTIATS